MLSIITILSFNMICYFFVVVIMIILQSLRMGDLNSIKYRFLHNF